LENYSEIEMEKDFKVSFLFKTYRRKENTIGIRVIKKDGSIDIINIEEEEITEDENVKIAVPNLEIGDILDLFVQTDSKVKEFDGINVFPAVETTLKDRYPILDYRVAVEVENDFFLNMNTYNGAPPVVEEETDRGATQKYVVEAQNIDKLETERWFYPLVEEPSIKFQIAFARKWSDEENVDIFTGEDGERKATVSKEDVFDYYDRKFNKVKTKYSKEVLSYLKDKNLQSKTEILKAALEYLRFYNFTAYFETAFAYRANIVSSNYYPSPKCYDYYFGMYNNDMNVIYDLRAVCKKYDIDYDVVLVQPRYDGKLDDLLIKSNARIGLKFYTEPELYFFDFNENMTLERFPYELEGSEAYQGTVYKGKEIEKLERISLSKTSAEDNYYNEDISLTLTDDNKGFNLNRKMTASGHFEDRYTFSWIHFKDFLAEDYEKFPDRGHFYNCGSKKQREMFTTQYKAFEDKKYEEFVKNREESADKEWEEGTVSDYSTKVINSGRYGENTPLSIEEDFIIKDGYIKKAGNNLIVEIGKFIGGQVELEDKERDRKSNVYLDFAKTYDYKISLKIPEGYAVKGLDNLNKSSENETGKFISNARIENGHLIVETLKSYNSNFIESSKWSEMSKWLDAAYEFSQTKVLLEKI
jgi:hypothetical protein